MSSIPAAAQVVIIGGGAIGCSIAYHLAKRNVTDVVLLEKSKLTAGCTWHAAGLLGQMRSKINLTRLMQYSARLCATIGEEAGQDIGWRNVGSLRLAGSQARWTELKRAATSARSYDFDMHLISPAEAKARFRLLDDTALVGATWIPSDGYVDPYQLTMAYAAVARRGGVRILEGVAVEGFEVRDRRIESVITQHGKLKCETVVNAAGLWARHVGEMLGLELPVTVVEHQYLVTEKSSKVPDDLPTLRDPDSNFYVKPEPGALAIGGWERRTVACGVRGKLSMTFGQELLPENQERILEIAQPASARIPVLDGLGVRTIVNGPIPISADGEPVMGRPDEYRNLFVACGFTSGIAASGGAGMAMANWICDGDPGMDLWSFDLRRFGRPHGGLGYLAETAVEAYSKYYAVAWPDEERSAARPLRQSPLHRALANAGAIFGQKFGYERPNYFLRSGEQPPKLETFERPIGDGPVRREHMAVRNGAALIDMSSFSKLELCGSGVAKWLNRLCAADVDRPVGKVVYTQLLNARGGIEADLTIMRTRADAYYVVTGSGFGVRDFGWIRAHLPSDGSCQAHDVSSAYSVLNLTGPLAREVLARVTDADVSQAGFPYMSCRWLRIGNAPVLAARITYVGELGWELHVPSEYTSHVFERLLDAGQPSGLTLAGYKAINSLRMEKRYLYWSADITPEDTPFEAGLGFAVALGKADFIGRDVLIRQRNDGVSRRLGCFALEEPLSVFGGEAMIHLGKPFGMTTSGDYGHAVGRSLVLGYVPATLGNIEQIEVEAAGRTTRATRIERCAWDPSGDRLRA